MKVCRIKTSSITFYYNYYTTCDVHEKGSALIRFKTTTATASNPAAVVRIYQTLTERADQNTNAEMSFFLVCSCTAGSNRSQEEAGWANKICISTDNKANVNAFFSINMKRFLFKRLFFISVCADKLMTRLVWLHSLAHPKHRFN